MATEFRVSVPVSLVAPGGGKVDASSFPSLAMAVKTVSEAAHAQWVGYALGDETLPGGGRVKSRDAAAYARSITLTQTGDFSAVVSSSAQEAEWVETGRPARDLKRMLGTSRKVRRSKDGSRYLVIPFRHGGSASGGKGGGALPAPVANWWKGKRASQLLAVNVRVSGLHASDTATRKAVTAPAGFYSWGSRLGKSDLAKLGITGGAAKRMSGMVNFRAPAKGAAGKGLGGAPGLVTFRTMSEKSNGWIVPAKPGQFPARATANAIRPVAVRAFSLALSQDLKRLFGAG